jgi:putative transposase
MREPRDKEEGAIYAIGAKTNNNEMFFEEVPGSKELMLEYIQKAHEKFDFELINFSIMGNHVHLLIKPGEGEDISRIMQWLLGCFAQEFNRRNGRSGHFWGERFWSRIVTSDEDLENAFEYVSENPVKAGLADKPESYEYGAVWHYKEGERLNAPPIFKPGSYEYLFKRYECAVETRECLLDGH